MSYQAQLLPSDPFTYVQMEVHTVDARSPATIPKFRSSKLYTEET